MPKVSVLVPLYKTEPTHLREAINSILAQTFTDFELILLDDCPEDDRASIVAEFTDPRIRYAQNEKNLGISPTRNKLIDMAQGEYLAIFDHDDISAPQRLEKQSAYLDNNPNVGVVGSWRMDFLQNQLCKLPAEDSEIKKLLMEACAITHPAAMIRKSLLNKHALRYEEEYSPSEDYRLWLRLIEHTEFHNIQEALLLYRNHGSNTSAHQQNRMMGVTRKLQFWVRNQYPELYRAYLQDRTTITKVKLFNVLPLLTIKKTESYKVKVYLFGFIPFISLKSRRLQWPD